MLKKIHLFFQSVRKKGGTSRDVFIVTMKENYKQLKFIDFNFSV